MKVTLIEYTNNAAQLLVFSKRTRHLAGVNSFDEVKSFSEERIQEELNYVFTTISSSWEFVDYVFLLEDVTRAFTHQLVRQRIGTSFAQQTQRGADMREFDYEATGQCKDNLVYDDAMASIKKAYSILLESKVNIQDARGILPTNILTNILFKANLRTLNNIMNMRLCVRAQGEFQKVARAMREEVVKVHPWAAPVLVPFCVQWGVCQFPRFEDCPIKQTFHLDSNSKLLGDLKKYWKEVAYESQPNLGRW